MMNKFIAILSQSFEIGGGSSARLVPMEGLRGFAVFLVFLVHYVALADIWLTDGSLSRQLGWSMFAIGNIGVDLFFVLSGYLIYGSIIQRAQPWKTYLRR